MWHWRPSRPRARPGIRSPAAGRSAVAYRSPRATRRSSLPLARSSPCSRLPPLFDTGREAPPLASMRRNEGTGNMERHYGMDWLRIGAFGLLILYHIGMVFVPWGLQVKTAHPMAWLDYPMLLTNPWRLTLLFVVSGYASRALFAKSSGVRGFFTSRTVRLLIPLASGVVVMVPPQTWVELVTQHGYGQDFGSFLLFDYFRFTTIDGVGVPTWN